MKKRIGRRLVSLLLTVVTILTMLPAMTLPALAATSGPVTGLADENIGLSFTGGVDNAWKAGGKQIEGHARSKPPKWFWESQTDYTSTLTITNKKTTTATLSFDYVATLSSGTIRVDSKTVQQNGTDSFSKELAPNGTATVYIKSGSTSDDTKITMTNVTLVSADTTATVTFQPAENGSYTVDGKTITEEYTNAQSSSIAYKVDATPADGYRFKGWYDVNTGTCINTNATTALSFDSDCTITARFRSKDLALFETGGQRFADLNEAVAYAQANGQSKITLATDGSISGTYTIPAGITLLIPFDAAGTLYTDAPAAIRTAPESKAFRTLTMSEGTSITVNGAISLGGRYYAAGGGEQGRPVGDYGYIKMADNSSITVKNGGNLYAWGFISGSGSVLAESGATVYEFYQIADFRGGSASSNMGNKVFPFSQYFVQNIEVPLTLNAGANEQVYTGVYAMRKTYTTAINFIGDTGMFKVESGSFTKDYDEKTDRLVFTVNGKAALNTLSLTLAGMDVNSARYVLPITNNITINIQSGNVTINQDAALLAGVEVNIAEGAGLTVADKKNIYIYDRDEWVAQNFVTGGKFKAVPYAPGKHYKRTDADLKDVKMDVNGSVTAIGAIYTTAGGADICSSAGTGVYNQQGKPGTETKTYQYTQNNSSVTAHEIPITAAKLKNADGGGYTETAKASAGQTIPYCTCPTCGKGKWLKDFAAIIDSTDNKTTYHPTLQDAVTKFPQDSNGNTYIKMLHSTTEDIPTENINTNKDLYLDLNGCTVTGDITVTSGYKLYGMDSSVSKDYVTAPSGKIVGKVTGTVAPTYQTPPVTTPDGDTYDRYVAIQGTENGTSTLSFHRFNISVTGYRFELAAPQCALFFIGKFQGDDAAKTHLKSLGFTLNGENSAESKNDSLKMPEALNDEYVKEKGDAYLFEFYLKRSFEKNSPATAYTETFSAIAHATFDNGGTQDSKTQYLSFKDAWQNSSMTEKDKAILNNFFNEFGIKIQVK